MSPISIKIRQAVLALILWLLEALRGFAHRLGRLARRVAKPITAPHAAGSIADRQTGTVLFNGMEFRVTDVQISLDKGQDDDPDREALIPPKAPPPKVGPDSIYAGRGRPVRGAGLLGRLDPSLIPADARSVKWEAGHLFSVFAPRPTRHSHGLHCPEPPLAAVCPECDWRQPVISIGEVRTCGYCGTIIAAYGTRLYWWFENETPSIAWPPAAGAS